MTHLRITNHIELVTDGGGHRSYYLHAAHMGNGAHFTSWLIKEDGYVYYDGMGTDYSEDEPAGPTMRFFGSIDEAVVTEFEQAVLRGERGYRFNCLVYVENAAERVEPKNPEILLSGDRYDSDHPIDEGDLLDYADVDEAERIRLQNVDEEHADETCRIWLQRVDEQAEKRRQRMEQRSKPPAGAESSKEKSGTTEGGYQHAYTTQQQQRL